MSIEGIEAIQNAVLAPGPLIAGQSSVVHKCALHFAQCLHSTKRSFTSSASSPWSCEESALGHMLIKAMCHYKTKHGVA